jgi:protein SCO1
MWSKLETRGTVRHTVRLLLALGVASLIEGAAAVAPATDTGAGMSQSLRRHFPNVAMRTQDGKAVRFYDDMIKDKVVVIQLMFTDCSKYCSTITPNLVEVQELLRERVGNKVSLLSLTVDPENDTPQVLRAYADQYHVKAGWNFLTGRKSDVDLIRRKLGVYDPDENVTEHMAVLTIGNEREGQWLAMPALSKPQDIVRTVERIMKATAVSAN